jgi:dipeptide/tripeptide permease
MKRTAEVVIIGGGCMGASVAYHVIATVGFALLNMGIGFLISALFENTQLSQPMKYALGFLVTGAIYLLLGGGVIMLNKKRLAGRGIVPERSMAELEKDKQWLKKEL